MTSSKPGMTRIVAGESAVPKRKRAIEAALAIGLVVLIALAMPLKTDSITFKNCAHEGSGISLICGAFS